MIEQAKYSYRPDTVSPPGETLFDVLEERGMSQAELAERTGRPLKTINEIVKGKAAITPETAIQLERVLGIDAEFWNQREANYRAYLASEKEVESLTSHKNWLRQFPINEMKKRNWIPNCESITDQLICVLNFFGVASPEQWDAGWTQKRLAFKKAMNLQTKIGPTSVWLRKGEIEGERIDCEAFNKDLLLESLPKLRTLTGEADPTVFVPKLQQICASFGVAVVLIQPFEGVPVYGSSCWLNSEKALIQLSVRGRTSDLLWFTFFHELGHILKHSKKELFIEMDSKSVEKTDEEIEADEFASEALIPKSQFQEWANRGDFSQSSVVRFANLVGVCPSVVVGRLQFLKLISYSSPLRSLKRKYKWS